jgi:hypothetical protein
MPEEVLDAELLDESTTKALATQRSELQKTPGNALFMAALQAFLNESEEQVRIGLRGLKTFTLSAEAVLKRKVDGDEDYKSCVSFQLDAGERKKAVIDAFEIGTGFFYKFHRTLTGLRSIGSDPWGKLESRLERHAAAWHMEQKRLKEEADRKAQLISAQAKSALEIAADEKFASGYVAEGEALLREAETAAAPMPLPDFREKISGVREATRWNISVTDVLAVAKAVVEGTVGLTHAVKVRGKKEMEERPLLIVDESVIRALIDRMGAKEVMRRIPGVSIVEDVKIGGTGR